MNRAEKRRQKRLAKKAAGNATLGKPPIRSPGQQTPAIDQTLSLAMEHHTAGRLSEAESCYEQILQIDAKQPVALHLLGLIAHQGGNNDLAVELIGKAIRIWPKYAEAHSNLGLALQDLGKLDEAEASFRKALAIKPNHFEAHNNLGSILNNLGKYEEAIASLIEALRIKPVFAEAHRNLSTVYKYKVGDPQIQQMLELIERNDLSKNQKMHLSFALGKAHSDIGDHDKAFSYFLEGNRLRKNELDYNIAADRVLFADIVLTFSKTITPKAVSNELEQEYHKKLIFILGMPRSGTSLVEQILASHSQVHGAGELALLTEGIKNSSWRSSQPTEEQSQVDRETQPFRLAKALSRLTAGVKKIGWRSMRLSEDQAQFIRDAYLSRLAAIGVTEKCITDKMPINFLWIGFILAALPEARIIHVKRDARAICWSIFRNFFSTEGNGYAYDLSDVAEYYKMYAKLMAFWHAKFPSQIYDLSYETLTEHQEDETRKLLGFTGLDWEDQCLEFHRT